MTMKIEEVLNTLCVFEVKGRRRLVIPDLDPATRGVIGFCGVNYFLDNCEKVVN